MTNTQTSTLLKQIFNKLSVKILCFLLIVILLAQLASGFIWYYHTNKRDIQGLKTTVNSLALSASSTISFFQSLPVEYRHLALNQLRSMGGTRFFVSLNDHALSVNSLPDSERKQQVISEVHNVLTNSLKEYSNFKVNFTYRDQLKVFNKEIPIDDLPELWANYSLSLGKLNPPILVIQVELAPSQWFYLAAMLPPPYLNLEQDYFSAKEWVTAALSVLLLLVLTNFIVRREIRPIKQLANAACLMSSRLDIPEIKEEGSNEIREAIRAFNNMNHRVKRHMSDRDMLFSAISHDLKTPIACLKLRTEMIDDDLEREKFSRIATDLDLMVKGALQCIKNTDIHEELEPIDVNQLIEHISSTMSNGKTAVCEHIQTCGKLDSPFVGKPLAFKRCLVNIIDNAIKYGDKAYLFLTEHHDTIEIVITDEGSGLNQSQLANLSRPYFRAHHEQEGNGLGLTISQSIAAAHGGTLNLSLNDMGGLCVTLLFPKDIK